MLLIPNALQWFTGEAAAEHAYFDQDDEDDEDDEDYDDEEEDEDDDEDDEEEDEDSEDDNAGEPRRAAAARGQV